MADGARFRNGMTVVGFEASAPTFIKDTFDFPTYFSWPGSANTTAIDDGYYSSGYDTTPPQDQPEPQFIAPSAFAQPAPSAFAQPPRTSKTNEQTYRYFAGRLDASSTVAEPADDQYEVDENFGEFQLLMERPNTQPTPSTVVQDMDQRSESEVDDDDDDEPVKSRPSRKNSKKDSTPTGLPKGGNNPFGSKGTRTCGSCRKRKGKVLHRNWRELTLV
jgi:hypothetical protein